MEDDDAGIDSVNVSFDARFGLEKGEMTKVQETPKSPPETAVTSKFVTVHELSPEQDYEQTVANFKAYFEGKPNESITFGDNTSFMSTNSELTNTPLTKPDCKASKHHHPNGWFEMVQEPILAMPQIEFNETPLCSPNCVPGGGSPFGDPIALCTEEEYEILRDQISLNLQDINKMIINLNQVHIRNPDEPLSLSTGDQKILSKLNRIKYGMKGTKLGYFPINLVS